MRIEVLGINSDKHSCQCCGKSGLNRVVWLSIDGGPAVHYGTACAAKAARISGSWTGSRAEALVDRIKMREDGIREREAILARAQHQANQTGRRTYVGYAGRDFYCKSLRVWNEADRERDPAMAIEAMFEPMNA